MFSFTSSFPIYKIYFYRVPTKVAAPAPLRSPRPFPVRILDPSFWNILLLNFFRKINVYNRALVKSQPIVPFQPALSSVRDSANAGRLYQIPSPRFINIATPEKSSLRILWNVLSKYFLFITHSFRQKQHSCIILETHLIEDKSMNYPGISPEDASDFIDKQLQGRVGEKSFKVNIKWVFMFYSMLYFTGSWPIFGEDGWC